MIAAPARIEETEVTLAGRYLVMRFAAPCTVLSWAVVGGGAREASAVAWYQVDDVDLRPPVDARDLLRTRLAERGLEGAVGLLTSRRLATYVDVTHTHGEASARAVATVGLGNALRAGDSPGPSGRIGTINVVCLVSSPLAPEAMLEALALAAEAKTAAVMDVDIPSRRSGARATGTGTDCLVIAAPRGRGAAYAGKHTSLGHLVGASVYDAVHRGARAWCAENGA